MKTNYLFFVLMAVCIICSCEREAEITETESPQPEISTEVIIHATMAQDGNTKTILQEDGAVFWQPGDKIAVFFNSIKVPFTAFNSVDAADAYFVGNLDITTGHNEGSDGSPTGEYVYWGLYPLYAAMYPGGNHMSSSLYYCKDVFWDIIIEENRDLEYDNKNVHYLTNPSYCSGKEVTTILYDWQKGVEDTFDTQLNIALAKSDDYHELAFYNVLGGIRFTVQSSDITRVTFKGNDGEALAGKFSVTMDDNGKPLITEVSIPSETITVSLENDEAFKPGVWYYAMMFPGTLSKGYTMEVYKGNKKATKVVGTEVQVKRSTFGSISNIDASLDFNEEVIFPTGFDYPPFNTSYINLGQEVQIQAYVEPENYSFPVKWFSMDPSIITISADGMAKGISKGDARIICRVDNRATISTIHILGEDECIDISIQVPEGISPYEFYVGDQVQLTAVPTPAGCTGTVVWSSSDESVATVDQTGLVTFIGEGSVSIEARIGDIYASKDFYCEKPYDNPYINPSSGAIKIDGDFDDWSVLEDGTFSKFVCNPNAPWKGIQEIRCFAQDGMVFYYIKFDSESLTNAFALDPNDMHLRLCINTDGEFESGYSGYFLESYDFIVEGDFADGGTFVEYDGTLFQRIGSWVSLLDPGNGLVYGKGNGFEYEISLNRPTFNEAVSNSDVPMLMGDEFQTGIRFYYNGWTEFSNMPNSGVEEEQGNGWGYLMRVKFNE